MALTDKLTAIGEAIRSKTGTTDLLTLDGMAEAVNGLEVGSGGFPNGTEWTQSNVTSGYFFDVVYKNGIWVASGSGLYYSVDGKTWSKSNLTSGSYHNIEYANGLWVVGDSNSNDDGSGIWYSTDGTVWSQSNVISGNIRTVKNAAGIWVAGSYFRGSNNVSHGIYYSIDGKNWTQSNVSIGAFDGIAYGNGVWIVCDHSTHKKGIYYSTDGKTWSQSTVVSVDFRGKPHFIDGVFYATTSTGSLYTSVDGINWTTNDTFTGWIHSAAKKNITVFGTDKGIYYSTDGTTLVKSNIISGTSEAVSNSNGVWVAGVNGKGIYYSTDGTVWTQSNVTSGPTRSVICENGIWVAGSIGLYYSVTWEPAT